MKALLTKALVVCMAVQGLALANAHAEATCKVVTNDIGTIVGNGRSPSAAFEDAAEKCFDRHQSLHKMKKGAGPEEPAPWARSPGGERHRPVVATVCRRAGGWSSRRGPCHAAR